MGLAVKVILLMLPVSLGATSFDLCPGAPPVVSLDLKGCSEPPCKFVKGKNCEFIIEILTNQYTEGLHTEVKAFALGTETEYPLPPDAADVCKHLIDSECPLEEGEDVKYHLVFPVAESYPEISLIVQFAIVSEHGTVGCLRLPAAVVAT